MLHHLQHIVDLVEICRLKGIQQVIISPGSRNAGLIKLFAANSSFKLHSIVDERSAGFYALGIALATNEKVALLSTSGTAVLNFGPALCEAYYQHIPLVAITADRPAHLIDQQDNQTIHQQNIFKNYIKSSISLQQTLNDKKEQIEQVESINRILNTAEEGIPGPVHINVPIDEPFYIEMPAKESNYPISPFLKLETTELSMLAEEWQASTKTMIICGAMLPNNSLNNTLNQLVESSSTIVLAEAISNLNGTQYLQQVDQIFWRLNHQENDEFVPDLLISFGGPIVSKSLKLWLQKHSKVNHYRISKAPDRIDTYNNLNENLIADPNALLSTLVPLKKEESPYRKNWHLLHSELIEIQQNMIREIPYSDLKVYAEIAQQLPVKATLHIGNSAAVRYTQLFDLKNAYKVFSNRGVSGIDGCVSTATGYARVDKSLNILLVGDLSFLYDSNALWNKNFAQNLKIVVINNEGGGIFSMIPGPQQQVGFEEFMQAHHPVNFEFLVKAYHLEYFECNNQENLANSLQQLFNNANAAVLLINTPKAINADTYRKLIQNLK